MSIHALKRLILFGNLILLWNPFCAICSSSNNQKMTDNTTVSYKNHTAVQSKMYPDSFRNLKNNELVILLHGFNRTKRDMSTLEKFFRSQGYHVVTPDIPILFSSLEGCTKKFEDEFNSIRNKYDRVHFVGHSFGGLIIRLFLSRNHVPNLGRCVLIATPNNGTELAAIMARYCKPFTFIFKPYQSIQPGSIEIPPPANNPAPEMGAIAGNKNTLFLGRFMKGENDSRVPVDSVSFEGMKELIVLPYHHEEIHHCRETAELVLRFIQEGTFGLSQKNMENNKNK